MIPYFARLLMPKYLIIGPVGENDLNLFWSDIAQDWVQRDKATIYGEEIWWFPPRELPVGEGVHIVDIENKVTYIPIPPGERGVSEESEERI